VRKQCQERKVDDISVNDRKQAENSCWLSVRFTPYGWYSENREKEISETKSPAFAGFFIDGQRGTVSGCNGVRSSQGNSKSLAMRAELRNAVRVRCDGMGWQLDTD
jgi:hypothetical protein